jgi:hypothetical protein
MTDRLAYKDDLPGSRRAPCLGCGGRVVTARDPHVLFGGKRDGSLLTAIDAAPWVSYATDVDAIYTEQDLYRLGAAHRDCAPLARRRLEAREVELPDELPELLVDDGAGELPELHLPRQRGFCPFCGEPDASEEHVFPKWISRELTKLAPLQMTADYGTRQVRSLEITAPVCTRCNNRWLSVLETDVQPILAPMIRGEERTLSANEQRLLAAWAVKTAMMLDLTSPTPVIPVGFFQHVRQTREALPSNVVWVGGYLGNRKAIWAEHRGLHLGIPETEPPNGFVTTFTVFRVLFQVLGHFTKGGATFTEGRLYAAGLWPIAPAQREAVDWPRERLAFNDEAVAELAQSING